MEQTNMEQTNTEQTDMERRRAAELRSAMEQKPRRIGGKPVCAMNFCLSRVEHEGDICLRCDKHVADAAAEAAEADASEQPTAEPNEIDEKGA